MGNTTIATGEHLSALGVRVCELDDVRGYLERFPTVSHALEKAVRAIRSHLPEAELTLQMYHDPEVDDEHPILLMRLPSYPEDVGRILHAVDEAYLETLAGQEGWLSVTTDFRTPEP